MKSIRETVALGLGLLALVVIVVHCNGCLSPETKAAIADSTYASEHLRCVDKHDTRAEIDACRKAVRIRWGIAETIRDGGDQ